MKYNQFNRELSLIKNPKMREFAELALESLPDYFYRIAASSTGKYHPSYSLGEGGLVRHTKSAVRIANELFNCHTIQDFTDNEKDIIIIALLLHDGVKHGINEVSYTVTTHPLEVVEHLKDQVFISLISKESFDDICGCIASHMGEWNKDYKTKVEVLPLPKTKMQRFVHMCDYLSSRKCIEFNFEV